MANEVQELVNRVVAAGGDTDADDALARINTAHELMVARSECYRKSLELGPLVDGTSFYAVDPTVVIRPLFFTVNDAPYGKARLADRYAYGQGGLAWRGAYGLVVYVANDDGEQGVELIPPPDSSTDGYSLKLLAVCHSPVLELADTPVVDRDKWDDLVDYAIALGRERDDERMDAGAAFRAHFELACEELRLRVRRRTKGPGPAQIRVVGVNA